MSSQASPTPAPQPLEALERANEVRVARAELKRKIATGETSVSEIVGDPPSHAASMSIADLLMSQKWWGRTRARRLLLSSGVGEETEIGDLTERQRAAMTARLRASRRRR